jgi:hypothetical protein
MLRPTQHRLRQNKAALVRAAGRNAAQGDYCVVLKRGVLMKISVLWLALLLAVAPAWAINKCTGPDGKVAFQDAPCVGESNPIKPIPPRNNPPIQVFPTPTPRPAMGDEEYEKARAIERSKRIDQYAKSAGAALSGRLDADTAACGAHGREPRIGVTAAWIRSCSSWGDPTSVNTTTTAFGKTQQWIYRHRGYLYFNTAGVLSSIQD